MSGKKVNLHPEVEELLDDGLVRRAQWEPLKMPRVVARGVLLPHPTLHGLRHCMASLMLADGASIKTVAGKLSHSNPSLTLDVYSH